jgi:hypothetical protein
MVAVAGAIGAIDGHQYLVCRPETPFACKPVILLTAEKKFSRAIST